MDLLSFPNSGEFGYGLMVPARGAWLPEGRSASTVE